MEQREEYLITLQIFCLMINRNAVLFTQFLCSISISWILPCINNCTTMVPADNVRHSWTTLITIKTAFIRSYARIHALLKKREKKPASALDSNHQFCC